MIQTPRLRASEEQAKEEEEGGKREGVKGSGLKVKKETIKQSEGGGEWRKRRAGREKGGQAMEANTDRPRSNGESDWGAGFNLQRPNKENRTRYITYSV